MAKAMENEQNAFNISNSTKFINDPNYEIYRSSFINPNELKSLQNILNPYAQFLDELISNAKFEGNADFKKYKLTNTDLTNILKNNDLKEQTDSTESRFKLENIYIIDKSNYNEALKAINHYSNTSNTKENLLVIFIDTIESEIKIQKPSNTYLYLISIQGNTLDCSFINNPLKECTKPNDNAELFLLEEQENNIPKITSLATSLLDLQENKNQELSAKHNDFTYSFNLLNHLIIKKDNEILLTLTNYNFYLQEVCLKSNNHTYICNSTLKPNKPYSTLGITLKIPQEQETFNNEGNFTIYLNNINLSKIQNQSKNTITQDSPIFCYIQESKQTFIAKLQENQTIIKCEINKNLTKDERGNRELINPKLIFLSFVPFQSNFKANNTTSQKLQLTSEDLDRGSITKDFKIPHQSLRDCERFKEWEGEENVKIINKQGEYLFSIEKLNIKEDILEIKTLYYNYGSQWFETTAEKYHKLLDINPDLKDKEKCEKLGLLYFTWEEIVKFSHENNGDLHWHDILFMTSMSDKFNYLRNMPYDWKQSPNGAKGYLLVSMEGIPYWADAVGQIPFAIDVYRALYRQYGNAHKAKNGTIRIGHLFADGTPMNVDSSNSYDNAMILRGINWAEKRYYKPTTNDCLNDFSIKNCGYKTLKITDYSISNLSKDSNGKDILSINYNQPMFCYDSNFD